MAYYDAYRDHGGFGSLIYCNGKRIWNDEDSHDCPEDLWWGNLEGSLANVVAERTRQQCVSELIVRWTALVPKSVEANILYSCIEDMWKGAAPSNNDDALAHAEEFMYWMEDCIDDEDDWALPKVVLETLEKSVFNIVRCEEYDKYMRTLRKQQGRVKVEGWRKYVHLYINLMALPAPDYSALLVPANEDEAREQIPEGCIAIKNDQFGIVGCRTPSGVLFAWCPDCFAHRPPYHHCKLPPVRVLETGMLIREITNEGVFCA